MKQVITILGAALIALIATNNRAHTYVDGAPSGRTSSPGDNGSSCNSSYCHTGPAATDEFIEISVEENSPGEYKIWLAAKSPTPGQYSKAGFQACVEDANGNKIGELATISNTLTKIVDQDYITHKLSGTAPSPEVFDAYHQWSFNWIAPENFVGVATIYAAAMLTNNDGENSGDVHVTESYSFNIGVGVEELNKFDFSLYPNPVFKQINISTNKLMGENVEITLVDLKGAELILFEGIIAFNEYSLDLPSNLSKGVYFLSLKSENGTATKKVVVQ